MHTSLSSVPSSPIVALASRAARHVQGSLSRAFEVLQDKWPPELVTVNDAIEAAEHSAREGCVDRRACELGFAARAVSERAAKNGFPVASRAALSAAEAARAASLWMERQRLIEAAERVLEYASAAIQEELRPTFEEDLDRVARTGFGLADDAPAPSSMLAFVFEQAIHEAGHAIAACLVKVPFHSARVIYDAGVDPVFDPDECEGARRLRYLPVYAAGAAAEELVLGWRRKVSSREDLQLYTRCGGGDFNEEVIRLKELPAFRADLLIDVASLLESRHIVPMREIEALMATRHIPRI